MRQLSVQAEEWIRYARTTPRFAPIGWRAHTLRTMLGTAIPNDTPHLSEARQHVTIGASEAGRDRVFDLLLWLAGPYAWDSATGWLRAGEVPGPEIIDAFTDGRGRVDMERLQQHLAGCGLLPGCADVLAGQDRQA